MFVLIGLSSLVLTMMMEYLLHRFYLHLPNHSHLSDHHKNYHGSSTFIHPGISFADVASKHSYILLTALPGVVLSLLFFQPFAFFIAIGYAYFIEWAHYVIHKGTHPTWIQPLFDHHKIHHISYLTNYGIGSTFIDYLFSTKEKKNITE